MDDLEIEFPRPCGEKWEAMEPMGSARHCARCDKAIHDLSQYTVAEAEGLLDSGENICVRAALDRDGAVRLKSSSPGKSRRMIASFAASVALIAGAGPALAAGKDPQGVIAGVAGDTPRGTVVRASDGEGRIYVAKVRRDGRYKIKHVRPGRYDLSFFETDDLHWSAGTIEVEDRKTSIVNTSNPNVEYIVGVFRRK